MISHKKIHKKLLLSEIFLMIGSVFIFRSLWNLMDKNPFFNEFSILVIVLVLGFVIAIPAWRYLIDQETHKHQ